MNFLSSLFSVFMRNRITLLGMIVKTVYWDFSISLYVIKWEEKVFFSSLLSFDSENMVRIVVYVFCWFFVRYKGKVIEKFEKNASMKHRPPVNHSNLLVFIVFKDKGFSVLAPGNFLGWTGFTRLIHLYVSNKWSFF